MLHWQYFVQLPIHPEITSKFGIIWKKGVFIPERTLKFIQYIKNFRLMG